MFLNLKPSFGRKDTQKEKFTNLVQAQNNGAKALGLSLAALATLSFAGGAVKAQGFSAKNISTNLISQYASNHDILEDKSMTVDFINPIGIQFEPQIMDTQFKTALNKLQTVKSSDKNYSWVDLPSKLITENYVSNVYGAVNNFKKPFGKDTKLIFVALGNPSNTDEIAKSLGLGANLTYDIDLTQAQNLDTIKKSGGNLEKIQVIVSSKSGSTFESNQTYKLLKDSFKKYYATKGLAPDKIESEVSKHFLFITDKNPEKSKLKKQATEEGIATIDAVDGLHSGFGDLAYSMPVLAYLGLSQSDAEKMLKSAENMSKRLQCEDLKSNIAGKMAVYDKIAENNGAKGEEYIFHDAHFTDFTMTMQQLYKESLRKQNFVTSVYPRGAHAGLESDVHNSLSGKRIITNIYAKNSDDEFSNASRNLDKAHQINLSQEGHFQKNITLDMNENGLTPEAVGEFLTLKSYVAYFKNEFETGGKNNMFEQDYVKGYKKIREGLEKN